MQLMENDYMELIFLAQCLTPIFLTFLLSFF